jgi:hypothetical protein
VQADDQLRDLLQTLTHQLVSPWVLCPRILNALVSDEPGRLSWIGVRTHGGHFGASLTPPVSSVEGN